jgi:hypothetical protein
MAEKKKPMGYKEQARSLHVVAIKKGQHEVNAPEQATWGMLKCAACEDEFLIGPPRMFGVFSDENQYVQQLHETLAGDHKRQHSHKNNYDFGA